MGGRRETSHLARHAERLRSRIGNVSLGHRLGDSSFSGLSKSRRKRSPRDARPTAGHVLHGRNTMRESRPFLEQSGFKNVFQLDGGILNYFEQCGSQHYDGDCFVLTIALRLHPRSSLPGLSSVSIVRPRSTRRSCLGRYRVGISCPHCYTSPEEQARRR